MEKVEIIYLIGAPLYTFGGQIPTSIQTKQIINSLLNDHYDVVDSFVQAYKEGDSFTYHVFLRKGKTVATIESILKPVTETTPSIIIRTVNE